MYCKNQSLLLLLLQGVVGVNAPFLYTFVIAPQIVRSNQHQVVQQTVMHTFIGDVSSCSLSCIMPIKQSFNTPCV